MQTIKTVAQYNNSFPKKTRALLKQLRTIIKKAAPNAEEKISYGMPGYKLNNRPLVYFAGFKNHLGFFILPSGIMAFSVEIAKYKHSKSGMQFSLDKPLPVTLIKKILKYRIAENNKLYSKK